MDDNLRWKTAYDRKRLLSEGIFDERQPLVTDNLWIEDDLCWKTTFDIRHPVMDRNNTTEGERVKRVKGLFEHFIAKAFGKTYFNC